jgi:hypothetical protein
MLGLFLLLPHQSVPVLLTQDRTRSSPNSALILGAELILSWAIVERYETLIG